MSKRAWVLYDGRAEYEDTFECSVMEAFNSRRDLRGLNLWQGHDGVLFEYELADGNQLVNERRIGHLREGVGRLRSLVTRS